MQDVVAMVPERDLGGADLLGGAVQDAAPQPRAQRTGGLARSDLFLHDAVGVFLDDTVGHADAVEIAWQHFLRKARLLLVKVDGEQLEADGCDPLQVAQGFQHGVAVGAAGHADHDAVALFYHAEVDDGLAGLATQVLLEDLEAARAGMHQVLCAGEVFGICVGGWADDGIHT